MREIKRRQPLFISTSMVVTSKRFVYIDLGANNGDSVYNFFGKESKYPTLFNSKDIEKSECIVYAFEGNPRFNDQLLEF
jgi:hypothetical protein